MKCSLSTLICLLLAISVAGCKPPVAREPSALPAERPPEEAAPGGEPAQEPVNEPVNEPVTGDQAIVPDSFFQQWLQKNAPAVPAVPLEGKRLVVSPDGVDTNPGTEAEPFRTIQRALDSARPGDHILVRAGVYRERLNVPNSGTAQQPIVIEGERGPQGEHLSVIDPGETLFGWEPAPEIGEGIFKLAMTSEQAQCLTVDGKQLLRVYDRLMDIPWQKTDESYSPIAITGYAEFKAAGVGGFSFLTIPEHGKVRGMKVSEGHMPFWEGVEGLYGVHNGILYLRFRDGRTPGRHLIKGAAAGAAVTIENRGHLIVRGFKIQGAEQGIVISGAKAAGITIDDNAIHNGIARITLARGAKQNRISNNTLSLRFLGSNDFGAWGGTHREEQGNDKSQMRMLLYRAFKHIAGPDSSADVAIKISGAGAGNIVSGNRIFDGLKGIQCMGTPDLSVFGNVIHHMSSVGVVTLPNLWNARFHDNLFFDCNIHLRIHQYNSPSRRSEYHYRNLFWQPVHEGTHIYVHYNDFGAEFGPEQEPPIGIYHNTFIGGNRGLVCGSQRRKIGMSKTMVLNNIISTSNEPVAYLREGEAMRLYQVFDYNWVGGSRIFGTARPEWWGAHNIDAPKEVLWAAASLNTPQSLAAPTELKGRGIDLSHPFVINGETHEPLPGMEPGYFPGQAPAPGAVQDWQSAD